MHSLTVQVYKYCIKEGLLKEGMRVIAGVSGGADSVCLLRMLKEMSEELSLEIRCVHIEHGIRGEESRKDMRFVEDLCRNLDVPLNIYEEDVPARAKELSMTVEEAGRHIRYEAFLKEAESFRADAIAVAHHLNDQAETVLFNLVRGSGLKGASGMAPKRGNIIRPLLNVTRAQIEAYLNDISQSYCIDSTNADTGYSRNDIRNTVMPVLEGIVAGAAEHISRAADEIREADDYIRSEAARAREETVERSEDAQSYKIDTGKLLEKPAIIRRYVIRSILTDIYTTHKDLEALHVDDVLSLSFKQSGRSIVLPKGIAALREGKYIVIGRREAVFPEKEAPDCIALDTDGDTVAGDFSVFTAHIEDYDGTKPPDGLYTKWFDYDKIIDTVLIRTRREGDYLVTGSEGQRKKLKKYFVDEKVPLSGRDNVLLLADGDHIMWVVGMRISAHYKITEETKRVLKVSYKK